MKRGRFSEEQIVGILKEHEAGRKIAELAREHGVSEATLYGWNSKYGGMGVGKAQRLRSLEDENRRLKQLVADLIHRPCCLENRLAGRENQKDATSATWREGEIC
jgi:putative transposase